MKTYKTYRRNVSLDNACYLISKIYTTDNIGNEIVAEEKETLCFCAEISTSSNEFFKASQQGLKPSLTLVVDSESYNGEASTKYNNNVYTIYRTYGREDGKTELYLSTEGGS